jgi:hypothetical protein
MAVGCPWVKVLYSPALKPEQTTRRFQGSWLPRLESFNEPLGSARSQLTIFRLIGHDVDCASARSSEGEKRAASEMSPNIMRMMKRDLR